MMRFYLETYGCAANKSDSEIIVGILSKAGLERVMNPKFADLIIVNTCIVKGSTKNKIVHRIKELRNWKKKLLIAGCMPQAYPELVREISPEASMVSTNRIAEIEKVVRKIFLGKRVELIGKIRKDKVCLPKIRENKIIDIIQICSGCLGSCSYCATKLAKGNLVSFSPEKIVKEIEIAKQEGVKEFWLTGQDISSYGFDIGTNLPELLGKVLEKVRGKYFIRLGMLNPKYLKKIIDPLLEICEDQRIFKFFHIPVQSGSDKVLEEMNRNYKVKDFEEIVNKIKNKFPLATIWTDIIVGYPSEDKKDFEESLNLINRIKPDWVNISKFYLMEKIKVEKPETKVAKQRSRIASKLVKEISKEQNKKWNNWKGEVLVDEIGKGRNFAYKVIYLETDKSSVGKFLKVRTKVKGLKIYGFQY